MASRTKSVLRAWCDARGRGAITYLARETGRTWAAMHRIVEGRAQPRAETAKAIERATDGAVSAAALLGLT